MSHPTEFFRIATELTEPTQTWFPTYGRNIYRLCWSSAYDQPWDF